MESLAGRRHYRFTSELLGHVHKFKLHMPLLFFIITMLARGITSLNFVIHGNPYEKNISLCEN
jgi:hypothetical protein